MSDEIMQDQTQPSEAIVSEPIAEATPEAVSDQAVAEAEAAEILATENAAVEAIAPKTRTPRNPDAEKPNPYGIHNDRGEVITTSYLRKYFQCATRGMVYNRAANIEYFMSPEFLGAHAGESAGKVSGLAAKDERWIDPRNPQPVKPAKPAKAPKEAKERKSRPATAADAEANMLRDAAVEAASSEEQALLGDDAAPVAETPAEVEVLPEAPVANTSRRRHTSIE